jgi:Holliday junction DNA helicase RuvA
VIGRLRGTLVHKQAPFVLLDVGGVGYEIEATTGAWYALPAPGAECTLYTHLVVREDVHLLFGFASLAERGLFRELIRVNGVGARLALSIVSGMPAADFMRCVQEGDVASLTRLPGIGKKSAERLVVEMRGRLKERLDGAGGELLGLPAAPSEGPADPVRDAVSALAALGYKPHEASQMVRAVDTAGKNSEEIIRGALQAAAKQP